MNTKYRLFLVGAGVLAAGAIIAALSARTAEGAHGDAVPAVTSGENSGSTHMVNVRVIGKDGQLTGPVSVPRVELSEEEWKKRLTPAQFAVVRSKGTERPFCGTLLDNKKEGYYLCVACGLPLFHSNAKFDSGTGWPSFFQPVGEENIKEETDLSHGMVRTEIMCARCDGHLGHVFEDGPKPTGLRYCLNSESMRFVEQKDAASAAENLVAADTKTDSADTPKSVSRLPMPKIDTPIAESPGEAKAVFAGGCFWCTEAIFDGIDGVKNVVSGYSGGDPALANYESVSTGKSGHAEAIEITYDPSKVTYGRLLRIFMGTHDPTQVDRQGPDAGPQYRSAVFYADDKQKEVAEAYFKQLTEAKTFGEKPIATKLEPLKQFHPAEDYHQDFVKNNPDYPYVRYWMPEKMKKREELLKSEK